MYPLSISRSVLHIPALSTLTSASSAPGIGTGAALSRTLLPSLLVLYASIVYAFVGPLTYYTNMTSATEDRGFFFILGNSSPGIYVFTWKSLSCIHMEMAFLEKL